MRETLPMNLPNSLTVTRIFLVPLLVVVLLTKVKGELVLGLPKDIVGAIIFAIASITDWADGYLARPAEAIPALELVRGRFKCVARGHGRSPADVEHGG